VLGAMAKAAADVGAALVATGAPGLVGCDAFARHADPDDWTFAPDADVARVWQVFRESRLAPHVALTAPRYLARHPYGKSGEQIEAFAFEELDTAAAHDAFLWAHASNLLACAVIDAVQAGDTDLAEFTNGEVEDLPVCQIIEDGERTVKCYAEAWLSERATQRLVAGGLLPVIPVKNDNVIRLDHLCSIARGPVALRLAR
jgi:type VI secretion system protein ImpC